MLKFDLGLAISGMDVITGDGRDARIVCCNRKDTNVNVFGEEINPLGPDCFNLVVLVQTDMCEIPYLYNNYGHCFLENKNDEDLQLYLKEPEPDINNYKTITSYENACKALNIERIDPFDISDNIPGHIFALMKLETISKALRGEWSPKETDDVMFAPVFNREINNEITYDHQTKECHYNTALLEYDFVQQTAEKAEFLGSRFIDLWNEYLSR